MIGRQRAFWWVLFSLAGVGLAACVASVPPIWVCKSDKDCETLPSPGICDLQVGICRMGSERQTEAQAEAIAEATENLPESEGAEEAFAEREVIAEISTEALEGPKEGSSEAQADEGAFPAEAAKEFLGDGASESFPEETPGLEVRPEVKPEVRPEPRPEVRPEVRPEPRPEVKPEVRPEPRPEVAEEPACISQKEICNNLDDDCDGKIDEDIKNSCYSGPSGTKGQGVCRSGTMVCSQGVFGACQGEITPKTEVCDGFDNDCDGLVDEGTGCVRITKGTYQRGSPTSEPGRSTNEAQHTVTLTRDFFMQTTEVTQQAFRLVFGSNPSFFSSCPTCPVEEVSWDEALVYANRLSLRDGFLECFTCTGSGASLRCSLRTGYLSVYACPGWRLPTEAEWEYAVRAGTTTATYEGAIAAGDTGVCHKTLPSVDPIAWYCGNASSKTHSVGTKKPNPWGLYDMSGNVWELVWDGYAVTYPSGSVTDPVGTASDTKVRRGGSWNLAPLEQRSANRDALHRSTTLHTTGFRLVRTAIPAP